MIPIVFVDVSASKIKYISKLIFWKKNKRVTLFPLFNNVQSGKQYYKKSPRHPRLEEFWHSQGICVCIVYVEKKVYLQFLQGLYRGFS